MAAVADNLSYSHSNFDDVLLQQQECLCHPEPPCYTFAVGKFRCVFLGRNLHLFTVPLVMIALPVFSVIASLYSSCNTSQININNVLGGIGVVSSLILGAKASGLTLHTRLYAKNVQEPLLPVESPSSSKCCYYRYLPPSSQTILKLYTCALVLNIISTAIAPFICK